ncbi:hypothetical protein MMRN_51470 [Mycobacterium marinum]|nr:hypothetical protein MMRN_51470 [Mycobacterium marinum]
MASGTTLRTSTRPAAAAAALTGGTDPAGTLAVVATARTAEVTTGGDGIDDPSGLVHTRRRGGDTAGHTAGDEGSGGANPSQWAAMECIGNTAHRTEATSGQPVLTFIADGVRRSAADQCSS